MLLFGFEFLKMFEIGIDFNEVFYVVSNLDRSELFHKISYLSSKSFTSLEIYK